MKARQRSTVAVVLLGLAVLQPVHADEVAATLVQAGGQGGTVTSTQGWTFTPAKNLLVTELGVYDVGNDGLAIAHEVGIWTSDGTLLVSASVPAGEDAPLAAGARYVSVTPTPLAKEETYVIGAYYLDQTDTLLNDGLNNTVFSYHPLLAAGPGRFGLNQFSGLAFPAVTTDSRRHGPNFRFTVVADRTWPTGAAPCDDVADLAACIEGADPDDIIEIAANAIPAQSVVLTTPKGFTLRPASGFTPTFGDFTSFFVPGADTDMTLVIEGLTLERGGLRVWGGSGPLHVTLRNNTIQQVFDTALNVGVRPGPTEFVIEGNRIDIDRGPGDTVSAIAVSGLSAPVNTGRISGNVINQVGGGQESAIIVANGSGALDADVIGNQISGANFNSGVFFFQFAPDGAMAGRVINNVVSGQVDTAGAPAAISILVSEGSGEFEVVNNTVAFNETGIQVAGRPDLGATANVLIANNIVAFNTEQGMNVSDFAESTVNAFNLVHGNGGDTFAPGPGTLTGDPLFVAADDLRVMAGSPAENSGSNAAVPADVATDAAGSARIQGIVDRGAFETAAGGTDTDADGVADIADNCTLVPNADQRDSNADGYGNVCDADLNDSGGNVNFSDLAVFRAAFGTANEDADFDGSGGAVSFADLAQFRALFGRPPGPSGLHP